MVHCRFAELIISFIKRTKMKLSVKEFQQVFFTFIWDQRLHSYLLILSKCRTLFILKVSN